jgi:cytosine permease
VFGLIVNRGGVFEVIAVAFLFINLGSVCTHCLYNSAMGWSTILKSKMRVLTLVLGTLGVIIAALGIWNHFIDWLNLLGVIVPPIGVIILVDQALIRRDAEGEAPIVRWQPFAAWAVGSGLALVANYWAPGVSTVLVGLVCAAVAYYVLGLLSGREPAQVPFAADAE